MISVGSFENGRALIPRTKKRYGRRYGLFSLESTQIAEGWVAADDFAYDLSRDVSRESLGILFFILSRQRVYFP